MTKQPTEVYWEGEIGYQLMCIGDHPDYPGKWWYTWVGDKWRQVGRLTLKEETLFNHG